MDNLVFFLLCIEQEWAWEKAIKYIESAQDVKIALNGYDLKRMGIKQGPVYQVILDRLRAARLDDQAQCQQDEVELVQQWMEEELC
jgi:tRNA nucleotidyltransferase (CCA-adding enzyme)